SVTLPPPSMTIGPVLLNTFAVSVSVRVIGAVPQLNVITPPLATAATKAAAVQLSGAPLPITVRGVAMLSACASAGIGHLPFGLPAAGLSSTPDVLVPPDVLDPLLEEPPPALDPFEPLPSLEQPPDAPTRMGSTRTAKPIRRLPMVQP